MNIPHIRLLNQQIQEPMFSTPEAVVNWMGAIQAQDLTAATWAIGLRMEVPDKAAIESAIESGSIVRIHVNRPTWHFVTQADLIWMMEMSRKSVESSYVGYIKNSGIGLKEPLYDKALDIIKSALSGGKHLTKNELTPYFEDSDIPHTKFHLDAYLWRAESRLVVSGGLMRNGQNTYMLIDERLPRKSGVSKDKALAMYATKYFRSHAPATLLDFMWWSGLSVKNARAAIQSIKRDLEEVVVNNQTYYIHSYSRTAGSCDDSVTLLPAYDEYLISYRDRRDVLPEKYNNNAYSKRGIFYRIIQQGGKIVGNWDDKKSSVDISYFPDLQDFSPNEEETKNAIQKYLDYNNPKP